MGSDNDLNDLNQNTSKEMSLTMSVSQTLPESLIQITDLLLCQQGTMYHFIFTWTLIRIIRFHSENSASHYIVSFLVIRDNQ